MKLFKDEQVKKVTSPEQLNEYIKVTGVSVWLILAAIILMLAAFCLWGVLGKLETKVVCQMTVNEERAEMISDIEVSKDMKIRVGTHTGIIETVELSQDGYIAVASIPDVADGIYEGYIITDSVAPVHYLFN